MLRKLFIGTVALAVVDLMLGLVLFDMLLSTLP